MLTLKCDVSEQVAGIEKMLGDDLPYTIARFLTMQAQSGQGAARVQEKGVFRNRNDWTVRNTKITPAKKDALVAEVYTDTSNWATGAPDYLPAQEEGAEKVPVNGREHLALPTDALRQLAGGFDKPIPDWLRPKALLAYAKENGEWVVTRGKLKGQRRVQPKAIRGIYFFKVKFHSGASGILARYVTDAREAAIPMYIFVTRAHIRKRFAMQETVEKQLGEDMEKNFDRAAAEVLVNNAMQAGFQVRF